LQNKKKVEKMKQYTQKDFENIYNEIRACGTVAGYLVENLENIPFADLRGRLENLRDLLVETLEKYQEKSTDTEQ
jgi:hypothetical protein